VTRQPADQGDSIRGKKPADRKRQRPSVLEVCECVENRPPVLRIFRGQQLLHLLEQRQTIAVRRILKLLLQAKELTVERTLSHRLRVLPKIDGDVSDIEQRGKVVGIDFAIERRRERHSVESLKLAHSAVDFLVIWKEKVRYRELSFRQQLRTFQQDT
jgi:hypothetical protein